MTTYAMRAPCVDCGGQAGRIVERNGQDVVYCIACDRYAYCAPKSETGREQRTVRTRPDIKPSEKARVLARDNHTCVSCHRDDLPLHVGHLLSVDEGRLLGATDAELFDSRNLAAFCEECNLGLGKRSADLRLVLRVLRAHIAYAAKVEEARGGAA